MSDKELSNDPSPSASLQSVPASKPRDAAVRLTMNIRNPFLTLLVAFIVVLRLTWLIAGLALLARILAHRRRGEV